MDFFELNFAGLSESKNQFVSFIVFSSVTLGILPWPPSLQTLITTSTTHWERLL